MLRKEVRIAFAILSWVSYVAGMGLMYALSGSPYRWVEEVDPQLSADVFTISGDARIATIGILGLLLLSQSVHALCTSQARVRGICIGLMVFACLAWMGWN